MKLKYYSDPGHGWIAVKRYLLKEFNIADKITQFSYQNGNTVYLEEDQDAFTLVTELAKRKIVVEYISKHVNSKSHIRNYQPYRMQ